MINVDDRIFEQVKKPEHMWLLLHIAKRMSKDFSCFPKNYTLAKDCGWNVKTVQKYKKELKELGLLEIQERFVNNKQAANNYIVKAEGIKVYVDLSKLNRKPTQSVDTQTLPPQTMDTQSVDTQNEGNRSINQVEVLKDRSINQLEHNGDSKESPPPTPELSEMDKFKTIIAYLTKKSGNSFRFGKSTAAIKKSDKYKKIAAKLKEGYHVDDFKAIIDVKCREWVGDPHWCKYLVPATLFCNKNFEKYLDEAINRAETINGVNPGVKPTLTQPQAKELLTIYFKKLNPDGKWKSKYTGQAQSDYVAAVKLVWFDNPNLKTQYHEAS